MRTPQLVAQADSFESNLRAQYADLNRQVHDRLFPALTHFPSAPPAAPPDTVLTAPSDTLSRWVSLTGLSRTRTLSALSSALQDARSLQSTLQNTQRETDWMEQRIRSYRVEIYKKFSIALACIVFMFIGAPLGLTLRRGGLATIGAVALGIFMFYWVTLVQGEKLSERGFFPPWLGMWIANLIMSGVGVWLIVYVVLDLGATPPLRRRLWNWLTSSDPA